MIFSVDEFQVAEGPPGSRWRTGNSHAEACLRGSVSSRRGEQPGKRMAAAGQELIALIDMPIRELVTSAIG